MEYRVTTKPIKGQSTDQVKRDRAACEATGVLDHEYAACMVTRGYQSYYDVRLTDFARAPFEITETTPHTYEAALRDFSECDGAARSAAGSRKATVDGLVWLSPYAAAIAGGSASNTMGAVFRACLEPKGYDVVPWQPPRQ